MIEKFYGLTGLPFQLTPDSRFYFESRAHGRAVAHLTFGLAQGEGFVVVTGEVGAGKTTLIEHLFGQLSRETYAVARITTTQVSGEDLFRLAMAGYGLDAPEASKATLLRQFEDVLSEHRLSGRRCLLIVDEVQNLSLAALEELRMLSNITEGGRASLQTILLGQPQFRRMLASPDLDQLRQRVLASYHLGPLGRDETRGYILHRLGTVGWTGRPGWEDDAFAAVFDHSGGIPRRINRLCSRLLVLGALEQTETVTAAMVVSTAAELASDLDSGGPDRATAVPAGALPGDIVGDLPAELAGDVRQALREVLDETPRQRDGETAELRRRVEALEARVARREQALQRLLDALAARPRRGGALKPRP